MHLYLLRRLLIVFPTLFVISVIVFFIGIKAPGDPAMIMLSQQSATGEKNDGINRSVIIEKRKELRLDRPIFYLDLSTAANFSELNKIPFQRERKMLKTLSIKTGRPDLVKVYYNRLLRAPENALIHQLLGESEIGRIKELILQLPESESFHPLKSSFQRLLNEKNTFNNYIPKLMWYGFDNQYHFWLKDMLWGSFGTSYTDGKDVSEKVWKALKLTLSMTSIALLLSIILSILLAVLAVCFSNTILPQALNLIFFSLYSTPTFIIATIALILFGSSQYLDLLPVYGVGEYKPTMDLIEKTTEAFSHFLLPILCLCYVPTAYLYQQLYRNLTNSMSMDYTIVARSKGLSRLKVITKHALANSLLPLISFLAVILPAVIGGSFVVEFIFSIPGMGVLTMEAVFARDYPVVFANLLLISFAALIGALLSDMLLMVFDPRISLDKSDSL